MAALPLPSPDSQLLAVVVAIRAARGGVGNITGIDLRSLRLSDPAQAVAALRGLEWQIPDPLLDGDPETPVPVTVPALAAETQHPLPFGKQTRSRVSGWTTRTLTSKPVKKTLPPTRLAALFLAAHSSSKLHGNLPDDLPEACRAALPELLNKKFITEHSGGFYRLAPEMRHFAGMLRDPAEPEEAAATKTPSRTLERPQISTAEWTQWKSKAAPALRRHVEAVESCSVCALSLDQVAGAFTANASVIPSPRYVREAYGAWKGEHPDRGPLAAQYTVAFRAEHGHGPSYQQLCTGLGWELPRSLRTFIVRRLLVNEWLTDTAPVPWTLRPGKTAQSDGIVLPEKSPLPTR
ncbi:hypothetical protein [Streptomyces sp. P9-2B-2]|uniref:hypothetical protein n=1 Tax=Streptomyces sp. P9-2B-2 TaxID=3057114 RepID=UPI0033A01CA3